MSKKEKYILYLWSPGMVYSGKAHNQFKITSEKLGYKFLSLVDEKYPIEFIKANSKNFKIADNYRGFHSFDLLMREAGLHYPVSFILENGRISRFPIIGVYSTDYLATAIKKESRLLARTK